MCLLITYSQILFSGACVAWSTYLEEQEVRAGMGWSEKLPWGRMWLRGGGCSTWCWEEIQGWWGEGVGWEGAVGWQDLSIWPDSTSGAGCSRVECGQSRKWTCLFLATQLLHRHGWFSQLEVGVQRAWSRLDIYGNFSNRTIAQASFLIFLTHHMGILCAFTFYFSLSLFSRAAVINWHTHGCLTQQKIILSLIWRQELWK